MKILGLMRFISIRFPESNRTKTAIVRKNMDVAAFLIQIVRQPY